MEHSHLFTAFTIFLSFFTLTLALPTNSLATTGHFTIEQRLINTIKSDWPPKELWRGLRKHHRPLPPAVSRISRHGGSFANGTVKVTPDEYDTEFVNEITIGNDTLFVDIDTGSSDLQNQSRRIGSVFPSCASSNMVTPKKQKTWFGNIMEKLENPIFTACLKHKAPGFYDFGFIDKTKHIGDPSYLPVDNSRGWWETTFNGFSTGPNDNSTYRFKAVVDTGTTFMLLPREITEQYYFSITGSTFDRENGGWIFPCNATLPEFAIHINDYKAIVPGEHINWAQIPGTNICFGGIQPVDHSPAVLGGSFLKSQFVIFDHDGPKMGFAAQR
ncbi:hypothetical protein A7C99_1826 [Trichophyton rubrum]|uniref:Peptidase A1 domain-containing protein n=2 Tax=Trichophyton TaxID=5550 RepID=A0A178F254_TRIRU|nr:hypothetical protein A7C99_1826 [Trichophyton rubrum]OAL69858.1 hypothetical protein A7D00_5897 [Trichophyton violaceum]